MEKWPGWVYTYALTVLIINVGTREKLVSKACYDKQQVYAWSATILMLDELIAVDNDFLGGSPLWCPRSRGISSQSITEFGHKNLDAMQSYGETVKT